ncbi:MAG TPA: N-acetyl-gamma-glutamyl-phosphate reductase [Polyangiaceae bacterium]|nr:N-acetyl-gamma-glutamyl-phosphate reductase [Polyangiaceae bacterium]
MASPRGITYDPEFMPGKRFKAAVIGGTGYGGAELIRRLLMHPDVELVRVTSIESIGERLAQVHPTLEGRTELRFEALSPAEAARGVDVVLLGLPHKVSAQTMGELFTTGVRVVDLSGDFRLRDPASYERYYGVLHPRPEDLRRGTFVYGLPELLRDEIRAARHVASPGCFATTIELALLPLARAGLLSGPVEIVAITGSSGSGSAPSATTHHPVRANNLRTYKPLTHQHVPEIVEALSRAGARNLVLRFVPVSAPLSRGIFATCFAHVDAATPEQDLGRIASEAYAGEPFVRVPAHRLPEVAAVKGTNYAEVGLVVGDSEDGRRVVACFAATDNLIKGGAGQAIQSMNLMLGLDERLTLEDPGGWP